MAVPEKKPATLKRSILKSNEVLTKHAANELIFAVVGHVGSGTSIVADALKELLEQGNLLGGPFDTISLKASDEIGEWAKKNGHAPPTGKSNDINHSIVLQDLGDLMRADTGDNSAVARALIQKIQRTRALKQGDTFEAGSPVVPDGTRRAYILHSVRHPAEAQLLQKIYGQNFVLIGVVADENTRRRRLQKKYHNAGDEDAENFMKRDADDSERRSGQHVGDAFHQSDYFIDNTEERLKSDQSANPLWTVIDDLSRLVKIILHAEIIRPAIGETAMHQAASAKIRSACLSRQVGAALIDDQGNLLAVGTNEVPKAGGGVYGEGFGSQPLDDRCAFSRKYCSNTIEQNEIIQDLIDQVPQLADVEDATERQNIITILRRTRIGGLLEFSRAVHAEMDALLSAARTRVSIVGSRLYVTTYPCHYCARHIVSAGVDEVQYIEPYPKSRALALHPDSITTQPHDWKPPSEGKGTKVLFRPFVGVAPRLYARAFLKDRDLKDAVDGKLQVGDAEWGGNWDLKRVGYAQLEAELISGQQQEIARVGS